jgi:hypothetical protein
MTTEKLKEFVDNACVRLCQEYVNNALTRDHNAQILGVKPELFNAMVDRGKVVIHKRFPTHEVIYENVRNHVQNNMNCYGQHNRESLNDLISDLISYRDSLPTVEDYARNELL